MAHLKEKYGAHLSQQAKSALETCKSYAPPFAVMNPLTRQISCRLATAEWAVTLSQIDLPYNLESKSVAGVLG